MAQEEHILTVSGDDTNPITQGFLCPRGINDAVRAQRNRVLYPHRRVGQKPGQDVQRISWTSALTSVADKILQTIASDGADAILHLEYAGNTGVLTWYYPQRFWNAIGATKTDYSICSKSGHEALALHYGASYGIQPEALRNQQLIVYWGFNGSVSSPHLWRLSQQAKRQHGAKIVVVDPRRSQAAKGADLWLQPRPGSDVILAYGIARVLIEQGYINAEFINQWTRGYDQFESEVMKWTQHDVETITGVQWCRIEELGAAYYELQPSVTMIGLGFQKSHQGAEAVRAVGLLPALVGLHRGYFYSNSNGYFIDFSYLTGEKRTEEKTRVVSQVAVSQLIEAGEFRVIYIYNMNPVLTLPGQKAFRTGLSREDVFVIVHETHWTETTDFADIVLPAPTYLEKEDLVIPWGHHYVRYSPKIINPFGESKRESWVMHELAKNLDLEEDWLFEPPWQAVEMACKDAFENGTFIDLMKGETLKLRSKPRTEYQTPSGKIEFYSETAKQLNLNPLPSYSALNTNSREFILLNSAHSNYTHTQFQEVFGPIPAEVHIHPEDAKAHSLENGDVAILSNAAGILHVKVVLSTSILRGTVWSPRQLVGLNGTPQNQLTPRSTQIVGNGPQFNSTIVTLSRLHIRS